MRQYWSFAACLSASSCMVVLLIASGCGSGGPEMVRVRGKVTYQGKAVEKGVISFHPTSGAPAAPAHGKIGPDGSYELQTQNPGDGAVVGDYQVAVNGIDPDQMNNELPGAPAPVQKSALPKQYEKPESSGLTKKVERGMGSADFDLK